MPPLPPAATVPRPPPDLRAVVLAVSGWAGALAVLGLPGWSWWVAGTGVRGGRGSQF